MRDTTFLPVHTLTDDGHADSVVCMAFSPAGTFLASGGEDGRLVLWDTEKGQSVARINMKSPVLCLRWVTDKPEPTVFCGCEDGRTLLVAGSKVSNTHDTR